MEVQHGRRFAAGDFLSLWPCRLRLAVLALFREVGKVGCVKLSPSTFFFRFERGTP